MKKILILGSTGSIGVSALDVVRNFPDKFSIEGLTTNTNINLLKEQIKEFKPKQVVVRDKIQAASLKNKVNGVEVLSGDEGLLEIARANNFDILLSALVGFAGLAPTIEGIKQGKRIALANKETLVAAGEIVMNAVEEYGSELIPVDSEHSAIFQCLTGEKKDHIEKLLLTASGGPFYNHSKENLEKVTVKEALNHPNWKMGNKVTIDSATMMNKGLEVIEASWLFGLSKEKIDVVIHPQSIIHSMVEFIDGSMKAQMSLPDMKIPIQYAFTYPDRFDSNFVSTKLADIKNLTFFEPDLEKFECLKLAYDAMSAGGTAPCIMNAANEIAVEKFLSGELTFTQIPELIKSALEKIDIFKDVNLETILHADRQTREFVKKDFN